MSRIVGRMAVAVVLVSMSGALALASPAVTMAETTGSISGTVTDATTKVPVAGVGVCATFYGGGCASTNASGEYTISGLATGSYKVEFRPLSVNYLLQYYNGKANESEANPVSVTAGSTTSGIDAALQAGGQITGKVTDASTGAPLEGITVCAGNSSEPCPITNSSGEYTIQRLASGSYRVAFHTGLNYVSQYYNGTSSYSEATLVGVTVGSTTAGIDAALQPGGQITGRVTDASTKATVAGVYVCASGAGGCASTNSSGEYTISQLPTGEYKLHFNTQGLNYAPQYYNGKTNESEANPVSVTAGSTTSGIDAALQPGGQITGRVTDASTGAPLPGIIVSVHGSVGQDVWTNHNGEYAAVGLASGEYKLEFGPPSENQSYFHQYYNDKANESEANPVSVTAGATTSGIDAALQPMVGVTAETGAASAITQTTATLNATVNPHGLFGVYCFFEYGPTTAYGSGASCSSLPGSGESPVAVSAPVTGLNANTTYHFRILSSGAYCCHEAEGSDRTFKTRRRGRPKRPA
jgi:hypothetical protein